MNTHHSSSTGSHHTSAPLRVVLAAGDLLRLSPVRPTTVTCLSGTCWLTQEGDALDHLLGAGMSHTVTMRGLTIVQAFNDCVVELPVDAVQRSWRAAELMGASPPRPLAACPHGLCRGSVSSASPPQPWADVLRTCYPPTATRRPG